MKTINGDWLAYSFILFLMVLSKIYGNDNMKRMAKKIDVRVKDNYDSNTSM